MFKAKRGNKSKPTANIMRRFNWLLVVICVFRVDNVESAFKCCDISSSSVT